MDYDEFVALGCQQGQCPSALPSSRYNYYHFDMVDDAVVIRVEPVVIDQCTWITDMGNAL